MTNEEMAQALRKAGWRVNEPLTQENCPHVRATGSGSIGCDGSGSSSFHCPDCGKASESKWGATRKPALIWNHIQ